MKALDTWERVLIGLIALVYLAFGLTVDNFLSPYSLADSTYNFSEKALIALAMALLIVAGEIDLSIAATMALASLAMGCAMQAGASLALMLLATLAVALFLHRSVRGRRVYAIGANPIAARFSGIAVDRYRLGLFIFAGLMAALAAILLTGRIGSTRPNLALGWELDAVTIVILGGVAIEGGRGSIVGVALAAVLMGAFTFALGMLNVAGIVMSMIVGVLLIVAMVLPRWLRRSRAPASRATSAA